MIYAGNRNESESRAYKDRRYTHTDKRGVNYYDCWTHEDEMKPAFPDDRLMKDKVKQVDNMFRGIGESLGGETINFDDED